MSDPYEKLHSLEPHILEIEHVKQIDPTACGAAALEMIYRFLGITDFSQKKFFDEKKAKVDYSDVKSRTYRRFLEKYYPEAISIGIIIKDAKERGLNASFHTMVAKKGEREKYIETIKDYIIGEKHPFIVRIGNGRKKSYKNHFVVVVGIDEEYVYYQDPIKENDGSPQVMKIDDFINKLRINGGGGNMISIFKKSESQ